jgi:putative ABC transport system substrate-binding protein
MRRRDFLSVLGGAAAAWPVMASAQQTAKLPNVGFLGSTTLSTANQWTTAFVQRLRELGWVEGRNVVIEYRWAEGRNERAAAMATEFVRLKVDVIVTTGTPTTVAAKESTSVIPIVFVAVADPIGSNLVTSLARPGGNLTGLSNQQTDVVGKRLELMREMSTDLRRVGVLFNTTNPSAAGDIRELRASAKILGLEVVSSEIRRSEDIEPAFEMLKGRVDALYVFFDLLTIANRIRINTLAAGARLPTMHGFRESVEAGGLMSYGANLPGLYRRAADYVDKILRGTKPADIPIEQPTKFDLVINLTTAKALGLTVPRMLLGRADEVIE